MGEIFGGFPGLELKQLPACLKEDFLQEATRVQSWKEIPTHTKKRDIDYMKIWCVLDFFSSPIFFHTRLNFTNS